MSLYKYLLKSYISTWYSHLFVIFALKSSFFIGWRAGARRDTKVKSFPFVNPGYEAVSTLKLQESKVKMSHYASVLNIFSNQDYHVFRLN